MTEAPLAIIFDLDGTLVDSAPLCADIVNAMLRDRGSERRIAPEQARRFLTEGGHQLVGALLGDECRDVDREVADFRVRYAAQPTPTSCLFAGIADGLRTLSSHGARLAICSNKPQALCDKIIADLGLGDHFTAIVGSREGLPLKPAPDLATLALDALGVDADACLYVGDSAVDRQTAAAAGMRFLFVTYGYAEPGNAAEGLQAFDDFSSLVTHLCAPSGQKRSLPRVA